MLTCNWLGFSAFVLPVGQDLTLRERKILEGAGNYLMTRPNYPGSSVHLPLYTGIAEHLHDRLSGNAHEKWPRAHAAGVTHVHIIPMADEDRSRDLETVLRYVLQPELQDQQRPLHLTAAHAARRLGLWEIDARASAASCAELATMLTARRKPPNALAAFAW